MVNPKKDYELLMRYLQGDALKSKPAAIPEETYPQEWQPSAQPAPAANKKAALYPEETVVAVPKKRSFKNIRLSWPQLKGVPVRKTVRMATAVSALLILLVIFWQGYAFFKLSPESVFNKIYVPFTIMKAQQPAGQNTITYYYATGNYVAATLSSKKQPHLSDQERLLAGLAYLHRNDYSAAIRWLEPLSNNFKSPWRQQAEYYLALTYLKNEDYDRCIEKMEHIAYTPAHPYHDKISTATISDVKVLKWK